MTGSGLPVLLDCLDLDPIELDLFRSRTTREPGHRLFGGEVAAQALVAAERTVDPVAAAHSLHASSCVRDAVASGSRARWIACTRAGRSGAGA